MNADAFRHLYGYHFSENRLVWDQYVVPLSQEQFTQDAAYSHGSVQKQVLHMINADEIWFRELEDAEPARPLDPVQFANRKDIRLYWDRLEDDMRGYLGRLRDDMLLTKPITQPDDDKVLFLWQVLIHVVNHGTDHRAQLLRLLNDLGVKTVSQDYIFYVYDHL